MKRRKQIIRMAASLGVIYVLGGVLLYAGQDWLFFHPQPLPPDHKFAFSTPFVEENITVDKQRNLNLVRFLPDGPKKGIVLYFHGNMRNIERYAPFTEIFTRNGYEVWMPDYPGFGKSTGKRSEQTLYRDALLVYERAAREQSPQHLIIYGRSIGTGIASYLAAHRKSSQLVLETPYYSVDALARHYFPIYPVAPLTKYSFPIHQYLPLVSCPITIFHGTEDEVVPYQQSVRLKQQNRGIVLHTIPKGKHNNLNEHPLFNQELEQLLNK